MRRNIFLKVFDFYYQGFRNMSKSSKTLWIIILVKLFIMFVIIKLLFMPDILKKKFENDKERGEFVLDQLSSNHQDNIPLNPKPIHKNINHYDAKY